MFGEATVMQIATAAKVTPREVRAARLILGLPSRGPGQPRKGRVSVEMSLRPETLAAIDASRGGRTRGEWLDGVVNGH